MSRRSIVTSKTRIGANVDVFEVSEREAVDIDTFGDLKNVASILEEDKVAIYVNGNNKRGIGHIYRALEIADEFFVKPDIYYDTNQTDVKVFGKTAHNLIPINGIAELYNICKKKQYSIFINDILSTSLDYMIGLRSVLPQAKIINFEDDGEGAIKANLVFNALYHDEEFKFPKYCYHCGKPLPWTEAILQESSELIDLMDVLTDEQKQALKEYIPNILTETSSTKSSAIKIAKLLKPVGRELAQELQSTLID